MSASQPAGQQQEWPAPWFTADAVVISDVGDGEPHVLLVRRSPDSDAFADSWALPGGFVNERERAQAAAARELAEETGVEVDKRLFRLAALGDAPHRDPRHWTVSAVYLARIADRPAPAAADDAAEARWIPLWEALDSWLAFDHRYLLRKAAAQLR